MGVTPASFDLGHILSNIPQAEFSMNGFDDRLRLQKIIYTLQAFGVYLGYDFLWYIRGPYCTTLTQKGFELSKFYTDLEDVDIKFCTQKAEKGFKNAKAFLKMLDKDVKLVGLNFTDKLEIATSIHLLRVDTTLSHDDIFEKVANKQERFKVEHCEKIYDMLKKQKMLNEDGMIVKPK
ncbi:MAG: hypothetical protein K8823_631 [Cenarchaeum symbiont of Oopsacas minuta]|nr:hypothetical protein [Cenarchaeum symbiont of Oopsacas minuta]